MEEHNLSVWKEVRSRKKEIPMTGRRTEQVRSSDLRKMETVSEMVVALQAMVSLL